MWQNTTTRLDRTVQCGGTRFVYGVHQTLPSLAEVGLLARLALVILSGCQQPLLALPNCIINYRMSVQQCTMFPFVLFGVEDQLIRVNESLQSVVALSISTHCLLFILRIPIIFLPISILLVFVVCGSKPAVSAGQTTNKFLSCLCRKNTHSLGLCILTLFRDYQILVLFILLPHYLSKQSVASFPDCVGVVWEWEDHYTVWSSTKSLCMRICIFPFSNFHPAFCVFSTGVMVYFL